MAHGYSSWSPEILGSCPQYPAYPSDLERDLDLGTPLDSDRGPLRDLDLLLDLGRLPGFGLLRDLGRLIGGMDPALLFDPERDLLLDFERDLLPDFGRAAFLDLGPDLHLGLGCDVLLD